MSLPDENTWVVPKRWARTVHPRRGGAFTPPLKLNLAKDWTKVRANKTELPLDPTELSIEELAAVKVRRADLSCAPSDQEEALTRVMLALHGVVPALELVLRGGEPRPPYFYERMTLSRVQCIRPMRRALASAPDEDYAAALARAHEVFAEGDKRKQRIIAYLFPAAPGEPWPFGPPHIPVKDCFHATCPGSIAAAVSLYQPNTMHSGVVQSLLIEFGVEALQAVNVHFRWGRKADDVVKALAEYPHDAITEFLFEHADRADVLNVLPQHAERFPQRVLRVALDGLGVPREIHKRLPAWVEARPEAARAVLPTLSEPAQAKLRALLDKTGPQDDGLHPIFSDWPWLRRPRALRLDHMPPLPPPHVVLLPEEQAKAEVGAAHVASLDEAGREEWFSLDHEPGNYSPPGLNPKSTPNQQGPILLTLMRATTAAEASELLERMHKRTGFFSPDSLVPLASPFAARMLLEQWPYKHRPLVQAWANRHPEYAARAWLGLVLRAQYSSRVAYEEAYCWLAERYPNHVDAAIDSYIASFKPKGKREKGVIELLGELRRLAFLPKRIPKVLDFLTPNQLPRPLTREGTPIPVKAAEALCWMLSLSTPEAPYGGLAIVREELDAGSLTEFGWAAFEAWTAAGAKKKNNWATTGVVHFHTDALCHRLDRYIRQTPPGIRATGAYYAIELLGLIATDTALIYLDALRRKAPRPNFRTHAWWTLASAILAKGWTAEDVPNRLVPTLGLDEKGELRVDFGPRHFTVRLDQNLRPVIFDEDNKVRKSLPKPNTKDDAATAEAALKQVRVFKKTLKTMAGNQLFRFEHAMAIQQLWRPQDFIPYIAQHRLISPLARSLVWGAFDASATLRFTFRVTDEGELVDADEEPVTLAEHAVGVLHPATADAATLATWTEVFADFELIQPFAQLGRAVHELPADQRNATELILDPKRYVKARSVLGLTRKGWSRGEEGDHAMLHDMSFPIFDGRQVRMVFKNGIDPVDIDSCRIRHVVIDGPAGSRTWDTVPRCVVSEVIGMIRSLPKG